MSDKANSWIKEKWRPMMAIMYMVVCIFDFIFFPILWTMVQFWEITPANDVFRQWTPLTLQNGGLFHMAMGAVLGVAAWSRGQEKLAGVSYTRSSDYYPQQRDSSIDPPYARYDDSADYIPEVKPIIRKPR